MGSLVNFVENLACDAFAGDERAREILLELDAHEALWGLGGKFDDWHSTLRTECRSCHNGQARKNLPWAGRNINRNAPTVRQVLAWFRQWPDAGPAVVLGPVSQLFVVDVDGTAAHEELLRRLGSIPHAPTVLSGSGKPHRYHLYFHDPGSQRKRKQRRGTRNWSFVVRAASSSGRLPYTRAESPYRWAPGQIIGTPLAAPTAPRNHDELQSASRPKVRQTRPTPQLVP